MTWKIIITTRRMIDLKIKIYRYYRNSKLTNVKYRDKGYSNQNSLYVNGADLKVMSCGFATTKKTLS